MKKLLSIEPHSSMGNVLHICWMLHNRCNKRCSYCREFNWNGEYSWLEFSHVKQFLEKVMTHYKKDTYHVSFTGGEPTLWPEFAMLVRYLKDHDWEIGLTSNGSRRVSYWEPIEDAFNWICLSYHPESVRDDEFFELVQFLVNRARVSVRLMMHKEKQYWDRCIRFGERLKTIAGAYYLFVEYVPLQDDFGLSSRPTQYADWQQGFFSGRTHFEVRTALDRRVHFGKDVWQYYCHYDDGSIEYCRPNDLVAHNQVNFNRWSCHVGLDSLFVNHQGFIYRGSCKQGGKIGHLFDGKIDFPTRPLKCESKFCPCGTDIQIRKFRRDPALTYASYASPRSLSN